MYQAEFKQSVEKDLRKLNKKLISRLFAKIEKLKINPYEEDIKKIALAKSYFRARVGDYRIIFQILDKHKKIVIHYIRHRKEAYRHL